MKDKLSIVDAASFDRSAEPVVLCFPDGTPIPADAEWPGRVPLTVRLPISALLVNARGEATFAKQTDKVPYPEVRWD